MLGERPVFKIYIREDCPYCDKARDFILREMRMSLHTIDITRDLHMREMVVEDTGQKTLPAIFLGGVFLGGCDDMIKSYEDGELELMALREENAILKGVISNVRKSVN
jgi:glutaredoxin|tara:strand:- start:2515 stop:2838 length:324 start_codon:yes stop_codon:yes gene_type:complete